ncbi:MAG: restriction endonuclease, partial [Myxococcales bacterium]|nr:restriction endonuclease [Myxococcales bacterium]
QHVLRDVIGRCLYGVDLNPMAAELCRVSLWLEALEPGKPLSFLDHHIRVGNSLLGTTPKLIAGGLPDEAFNPIEGDDKKACTELKKRNRAEGKGLGSLFVAEDAERAEALRSAAKAVDEMDDDTPERLARKAQTFAEAQQRYDYVAAKRLADAWCAAFVIRKHFPPLAHNARFADTKPFGITQGQLTDLAQGRDLPAELATETERLARQYQFFHWHLAFPEVFARGGFDCILANPPWERVKLQEKEWFANRSPDIANAPNAAARKRLIEALKRDDPALHHQFLDDARKAEGESHLLRDSGCYPLCGRGDINLYAVFAEGMRSLLSERGRAGAVLPTGIATDDTTKFFFQDVVERKSLASLFDFENKGVFFPEVHSSLKFCIFTAGRGLRPTADAAEFVFYAHAVEELRDPGRRFPLSPDDIALLNPNTRTCPIFRSRKDAELTKGIYRRVQVLIREAQGNAPEENPWGIRFSTMFHMSNDSHLFHTREQLESDGWQLEGNVFRRGGEKYLPLYEAKMVDFFDHRAAHVVLSATAMVRQGQPEPLTESEHQEARVLPIPRSWVSEMVVCDALDSTWARRWFLGLRDITSATNERTVIPAVIPLSGVGNNLPVLFLNDVLSADGGTLSACLSSFVLDFAARFKVGGLHLNFFIVEQFPAPPPKALTEACEWSGNTARRAWLAPRVLELTYTAWDLELFGRDCGWDGPPFRWDDERRFQIRCELDAAFFHLYLPADADGQWRLARKADGCPHDETLDDLAALKRYCPTPRDAVAYIMDTFPIVRRKDEEKYNGDYRTKRVILGIYDAMQEAIRTGNAYQTHLDPPPADPRCCHPPSENVTP